MRDGEMQTSGILSFWGGRVRRQKCMPHRPENLTEGMYYRWVGGGKVRRRFFTHRTPRILTRGLSETASSRQYEMAGDSVFSKGVFEAVDETPWCLNQSRADTCSKYIHSLMDISES